MITSLCFIDETCIALQMLTNDVNQLFLVLCDCQSQFLGRPEGVKLDSVGKPCNHHCLSISWLHTCCCNHCIGTCQKTKYTSPDFSLSSILPLNFDTKSTTVGSRVGGDEGQLGIQRRAQPSITLHVSSSVACLADNLTFVSGSSKRPWTSRYPYLQAHQT